jgi:hypothetical protein
MASTKLNYGPIDPAESKLFLPELTLDARISRLLSAAGFPEAYLNPKEAARLRNDRMELVTRESLQLVLNLGRAQERSGIKLLPLGK